MTGDITSEDWRKEQTAMSKLRVSDEEARERVERANNPESLSVRACDDLLDARRERDEAISGRCALNTQLDKAVAAVKRAERERDEWRALAGRREKERDEAEVGRLAAEDRVANLVLHLGTTECQLAAANKALVWFADRNDEEWGVTIRDEWPDDLRWVWDAYDAARAAEGGEG